VANAEWTYEVAPAGADTAGVEEYVVEDAGGDRVGKVQTLVERGNELYLVIERGRPPVSHDIRAVPWDDVAELDDAGLRIRLRLLGGELNHALILKPENGVEGDSAEARRVTELPGAAAAPPPAEPKPTPSAGPSDSPSYLAAVCLSAVGLFSTFAIVVAATSTDFNWEYVLFTIPLVLLAVAGAAGYRFLRGPY
jgi:hypothetical protein